MPFNHPKPLPPLTDKDISRWWSHVDKRGPNECWPWLAGKDKDGYGKFSIRDDQGKCLHLRAIRVGFFIQKEVDPYPDLVLHTCNNPPCCNGSHWKTGTPRDNADDRAEAGHDTHGDAHWARKDPKAFAAMLHAGTFAKDSWARGDKNGSRVHPERLKRGEDCHSSKLTSEQVTLIRNLHLSGFTNVHLSRQFNVSPHAIRCIVLRLSWKHLL
jgi:hypothetical protein